MSLWRLSLYIFIFLHQTTTSSNISKISFGCISLYSYIKPQLRPCPSLQTICCISLYSYIKPQLVYFLLEVLPSCISLYSYIKPQLQILTLLVWRVVYLYIPTSNHNLLYKLTNYCIVVYLYIPTSNHNRQTFAQASVMLYIFIFLHQTTTYIWWLSFCSCCISLYSYIKPQLFHRCIL